MVFVSVENKGAYRCLTAWRAGHSKIMCNSSATATLPQCVQTLLALATDTDQIMLFSLFNNMLQLDP